MSETPSENNIIVDDQPDVEHNSRSVLFDPTNDDRYAATAAWFLGPKAENLDIFKHLVNDVIDEHANFRRSYFPQDPLYVTRTLKENPEYIKQRQNMHRETKIVAKELKDSIPFFSMRYQGHMLWDVTIPSLVGYIAAIMYNQNNTAAEASPVTTVYEKIVGDDLAQLLGYDISPKAKVRAWGHITCDGTVANIESMWAARNLKFQGLAFREALKNPALAAASEMTVPVWNPDTHAKEDRKIVDLDNWSLLNLDVDDALALTTRINTEYSLPTNIVQAAMLPFNLQQLGYAGTLWKFEIRTLPVVFISSTAHYSWPKASAVLGIGQEQLKLVPVDINGRMDLAELRKGLDDCLAKQTPVIQVVAVTGSTEESCMDPLDDIVKMREEYKRKGLNYYVHADGAWGGYFATMLRTGDKPPAPTDAFVSYRSASGYVPSLPLSAEVERHIIAFKDADSVTIDPHKSGLIPYPAGGLAYRNGATRYLLSFSAPIVYKGATDPTIGIFGIEGSKPGAAATAVHLSHKVIPTNKDGYGRVLGEANFSCKKLHCILQTIAEDDDPFIVVPFHRLPNEVADKEYIRNNINGKTNEEIAANPEALAFLRNVGPDLIINSFSINFKITDEHGTHLNTDVSLVNKIVTTMFNDLNLYDTEDNKVKPLSRYGVQRKPLFFTNSSFPSNRYGKAVQSIKDRLGLEHAQGSSLNFLVNTVMDPWPTSPQFFDNIVKKELRKSILNAIGAVTDEPDIHGFLTAPQQPRSDSQVLYHKHFPMFHAPPHQYMVTIVADFADPTDRANYFKVGKENPDKLLVWANSSPLTLHQFVYDSPDDGFWCDHYIGLPPTGPPQIPFMHALMVIKDVIIFEHFDTKAKYPEYLTYNLYGQNGRYHMEHYITQAPNWDNMIDVKLDFKSLIGTEHLLELGILIQFRQFREPGENLPSKSPLEQGQWYEAHYIGQNGVERTMNVFIKNNFWFNNARVNVTEESHSSNALTVGEESPMCCFKNLRKQAHGTHPPTNL